MMLFEWDPKKSESNIRKHGILFEEARHIINDPLHLSILDERFSYFEERWVSVGRTAGRSILVVVNLFFNENGEEVIRIISAREPTNHERRQYEGHE